MISLQGVAKRYGARAAIHRLDLEVPRGVISGLLGHNGSGKSTIIGMLLGQVFPDQGRVLINGHDVMAQRAQALRNVGAIFETPAFYDYLSGARNLRILCEYTGPVDAARLHEVVHLVGLAARIDDLVGTYSHGMRQRLALAQALLPHPTLLILDEPSEGLDPEGIHEMRNLLLRLNREHGLTILFSSHGLSEVEQMCSHLAVLHDGNLLFAGDWRHDPWPRQRVRLQVERQADAEAALGRAGLMMNFQADCCGELADGVTIAAVTCWLVEQRFALHAIAPVERSLEDFYLTTVHGAGRA